MKSQPVAIRIRPFPDPRSQHEIDALDRAITEQRKRDSLREWLAAHPRKKAPSVGGNVLRFGGQK